ncbi:hypothetical protein TwortDSMZ_182 [Staphylococcus phage Twort]|uniref:Uncharacterized protein n=2 Tax=Staphylococcus phage Twort (strain DSM 17442 / HER 48) TaxID=2908167 RepID=A0A6H0X5I0_BPTWO|nr:ORF111 [Staphylococcus phage Twort]AAX92403.1 ORF111 [Staphylococcus phage Twort]QIW89178.1 hypothetical protein TwortDSMZ_182 [Staphylococcus phage Twort]
MERVTWEDIKRLIIRNGTLVPPNLHVYTIGNYQINYHILEDKICLCKDNVEVAVIKGHMPCHITELEEVTNKALRLNKGITSVIDYYKKQYLYYNKLENERKEQEEEKLEKLQSFMNK